MSSSKLSIRRQRVSVVADGSAHWDRIAHLHKHRQERESEEPFYVLNLSTVMTQWRKWGALLPRIQPHYAIKANPDDVLISTLGMLGAGFDCASMGEIDRVLSCGFGPDRIIFANTIKAPAHIRYAAQKGVTLMTVDNAEELRKIAVHAPEARLVLRIFAMDSSAISKLSLKFGCNASEKAPGLLRLAKELGLRVVGVSFHVGGGSKNPVAYLEAIANARHLFRLAAELGFAMELLDIGGGYPGFCSEVVSLASIAVVVNAALESHFGDLPNVRIISEPGRFFSMPSSTLVTAVIGKSALPTQMLTSNPHHDCNAFMYYINDGVFGSFNCVPVYKIEPPGVAFGKDHSKLYWSRIWGPTCDSADILAPAVLLPELNIGDWLVYEYMGAYTRCIASNFNGFAPARVDYIVNETDALDASQRDQELRLLTAKMEPIWGANPHRPIQISVSDASLGGDSVSPDSGAGSDVDSMGSGYGGLSMTTGEPIHRYSDAVPSFSKACCGYAAVDTEAGAAK